MISIYDMCEARLKQGKPYVTPLFELYSGYKPSKRGKRTEPKVIYLDALGELTERRLIAAQYGSCPKYISNLFKKHEGDFVAIHAILETNMIKRNNKK